MHPHREQRQEQERDRQSMNPYPPPGEQQADRAHHHDRYLAQLDDADDAGLVVGVGELAGERREDEERKDEDAGGEAAEPCLRGLVVIDLIDDEQHHRVLEQIVVERAQHLRDEQGRETALAEQP